MHYCLSVFLAVVQVKLKDKSVARAKKNIWLKTLE